MRSEEWAEGRSSDSNDSPDRPELVSVPSVLRGPEPVSALGERFERAAFLVVGLTSIVVAVVVLARPQLSIPGLLALLGGAVALNSARFVIAGGRLLWAEGSAALRRLGRQAVSQLGALGIGLLAVGIALAAALYPSHAATVGVFLLAIALAAQGFARILGETGRSVPRWLRHSSAATGAVVIVLVVSALVFEGPAILAFAVAVGVILLVNGLETAVAGLKPEDPRQFEILKLLLFSAFYGLVLINWIDLYSKSVPSYGVWLVLSYVAPFGVLLVFEGIEAWPLAVSLGVLVSLMNDLGYFFMGDLIFGFHEALLPWVAGQLGFEGTKVVTVFLAGNVRLDITSWMMGASIYARAAVVALVLRHWWHRPTGIYA
jgi:hypothetical protein